MARKGYRKYGRKGGAGKGGAFRNGRYNFTTRRKYALQRAADISARKRKKNHAATAKKVAVLAGVAGVAYLGYRNRTTIGRNAGNWAAAVNPWNKERTRVNNAISVGMPSQTTVIGPTQRAAAQATRDAMAQAALPPHMGGPDNRIYDENNNIDTDAMTAGSVKRTIRAGRKRVTGQKTESLTGTPGGRRRPAKANPANKPKEDEYLDYVWENDILVPVSRTRRGVPATTAGSANTTASVTPRPGRTRQGNVGGGVQRTARTGDPMRHLEGMRAADERLLSGKDQPTDSGVAPVEFRAPVMDKPAAPTSRSRPKAPTTNTQANKDAKPAGGNKPNADKLEMDEVYPGWDKLNKEEQTEVNKKLSKRGLRIFENNGRVEIDW